MSINPIHPPRYYFIRSVVRFTFWMSVSFGAGLLASWWVGK
jgi:hypothetical protein